MDADDAASQAFYTASALSALQRITPGTPFPAMSKPLTVSQDSNQVLPFSGESRRNGVQSF